MEEARVWAFIYNSVFHIAEQSQTELERQPEDRVLPDRIIGYAFESGSEDEGIRDERFRNTLNQLLAISRKQVKRHLGEESDEQEGTD